MTKTEQNYISNAASLVGSLTGAAKTGLCGESMQKRSLRLSHALAELGWTAIYCDHRDFGEVSAVCRYRLELENNAERVKADVAHFPDGYYVYAYAQELRIFGPFHDAAFAEHVRLFLSAASVDEFSEIIFKEAIIKNTRARYAPVV